MPRKVTKKLQRELHPDRKYQSVLVQRLINKSMLDGKKLVAERAVYSALEQAAKKLESEDPLEVFEKALKNVAPNFEVKSRRVGGANYQIPFPTLDDIIKQLPAAGTAIRDSLELLSGNDRLDISAIRGLEEALQEAKKTGKSVQIRGGGTRGFFVYVGGVKKGIVNSLNFAGGSGVSLAYSKVNGLDTITINASGSGISVETPPESVDASTTVFTVSAQPQWIVSDGTTIYEGAGYSYNSGTGKVTLDLAPSSFIRAII